MGLKQRISDDMKQALKAGKKDKVSALRMLLAELKNAEIDRSRELDDEEITQIVMKQVKKWEEAASGYEKAEQKQRALKERKDAELLREYLPEQLSEEELKSLLKQVIDEVGATSMRDMGKVMQTVMPKVKGRAEGSQVNALVKEMLS